MLYVEHNKRVRNKYISAGTPIKNKVTRNGKNLLNGQGTNYLKPIDVTQDDVGLVIRGQVYGTFFT
jgi:hypothetical protein